VRSDGDNNFLALGKKATMPPVAKPKPSVEVLHATGFLKPVKKGRPPIYETDEERRLAHKAQQKECTKRHAARVREARAQMLASLQVQDLACVDACG
jgi:hypothetical protein